MTSTTIASQRKVESTVSTNKLLVETNEKSLQRSLLLQKTSRSSKMSLVKIVQDEFTGIAADVENETRKLCEKEASELALYAKYIL